MSLPRRQQAILDQMDRALGSADPQLRSMYATFSKRTCGSPFPAVEVISLRRIRHLVLCLVLLLAIGFLAFGINDLNSYCNVGHDTCTSTTSTGAH